MSIFSYHLTSLSIAQGIKSIFFSPSFENVSGLIHSETMMSMRLGAPIWSPRRFLFKELVVFAQWKDEDSLVKFLSNHDFGRKLNEGWHIRMEYMRQWGFISEFDIPKVGVELHEINDPVVAVTLARMRLTQVPRFIKWGRPVEKLVRDDKNSVLSMAATRLPRTVSTFSIWKSEKDMLQMVHGHSNMERPKRHADAMKERERKDFHFQFTTLRFRPISEHGIWKGQMNFLSHFRNNS